MYLLHLVFSLSSLPFPGLCRVLFRGSIVQLALRDGSGASSVDLSSTAGSGVDNTGRGLLIRLANALPPGLILAAVVP